MKCFAALTYSIYVDGELPGSETREVEAHLAECVRCRELVAGLRAENELLVSALQTADEAAPALVAARPPDRFALLTRAIPLAAIGLLLSFGFQWITQSLPAAASWMDPSELAGRLNLLSLAAFYVIDQGAAMLASFALLATALILGAIVISTAVLLSRSGIRVLRPGAGVLALLLLTLPGLAMEKRSSKTTVTVAANETIDDSLLATADTVRIDGTINGDVIAVGRLVEVRGKIKGDLITGAQRIDISGAVDGNIFSWGQNVEVSGQAAGNVYGWAQSFHLPQAGRIAGGLVLGGADVTLDGNITRGADVFAGTADLGGEIGRNLYFAGGTLNLAPPARVGGNLGAYVRRSQDVRIASGVTVGGKTEITLRVGKSRFLQPKFYFWQAVSFVGALVIGWLMLVFAPGFFHEAVQAIRSSAGRSLGLGFAVLVATPVAIIILAITLIGLPVAFFGLGLYAAALYLAKIFVGVFLGRTLDKTPDMTTARAFLALLVGLLIIYVAVQIPYGIGFLAHLAVFCFGLGAFTWRLYRTYRPLPA
jgi:cytoskeletal protein CcmA (bactofilin family)